MRVSPQAARVLGCLVEKARTTPDQYPLSLNAVVTACNQTTNRWPVVRYDEGEVEDALDELRTLELVRREKPHGGRAIKYTEVLGRALALDEAAISVLGVLLLRGPQTPGELKARTERLHGFADLAAVDGTLRSLASHEDGALVEQLPREPGRKEARWQHRLGADHDGARSAPPTPRVADVTPGSDLAARVAALEVAVVELRARLDGLADDAQR
jgi:uncharacterized protein YceH (UPF0502 family)